MVIRTVTVASLIAADHRLVPETSQRCSFAPMPTRRAEQICRTWGIVVRKEGCKEDALKNNCLHNDWLISERHRPSPPSAIQTLRVLPSSTCFSRGIACDINLSGFSVRPLVVPKDTLQLQDAFIQAAAAIRRSIRSPNTQLLTDSTRPEDHHKCSSSSERSKSFHQQ